MANNIDTKYGEVTTEYGKFFNGEPVIVFRARDSQTPDMLRHYFLLCKQAGSPQHHLAIIDETLARFEEWQRNHLPEVIVPKSDAYQARIQAEADDRDSHSQEQPETS